MREQKESYVKAKSQRAEGSKGCRRCRGGQDLALHLAKGPKKKNVKYEIHPWLTKHEPSPSTNQAPFGHRAFYHFSKDSALKAH